MNLKIILTVALLLTFVSCKKYKEINVSDLRLTTVEWETNAFGNQYQMIFDYDATGRITQVMGKEGVLSPKLLYTVQYAPNLIIISTPAENGPNIAGTDTTYLQVDANNRVTRRISVSFFEVKPPQNPQRTYTRDTTTYEYNAEGLLTKEVKGYWDSTWFNPGTVQTGVTRRTGTLNHTISNGDAVLVKGLLTLTSITRTPTNTFTTTRTEETSNTYDYSKSYRNKTDFSNTAVQTELHFSPGLPLNPNYAHLPDKIAFSTTDKDQNGNVISIDTSTLILDYSYNVFGWVSRSVDPRAPIWGHNFKYGAP